jgi:putative membrane-bound dehydrogenase-like protein
MNPFYRHLSRWLLTLAGVQLACQTLAPLALAVPTTQPTTQPTSRPIKALFIAGGCCHDYDRQKLIIPRGVSARADVQWTIAHQGGTSTASKIPLYLDPAWAEGFDVIVHNECFSDAKEAEWVERILAPHRAGTPAVLIHCAMHSYRTGSDAWFEFCGIQSPGHGPHYAYDVLNIAPEHPVMRGFGNQWRVPKGELYFSQKVFPTARPLAHAPRQEDGVPQVCVWTNQYHQARVFGTTIGHYNETVAEPQYLDMLTRGLLWAVHGDSYPEPRQASEEQNQAVRALVAASTEETSGTVGRCCNQGNLVFEKPTRASSEESGKQNFAKHAVDGNLNTRWCAAGPGLNEWLSVDLGEPQIVQHLRLHWEQSGAAYRYRIEGSLDGEQWQTLVDASRNRDRIRVPAHEIEPVEVRHLKVTFLGASTGVWGSLWEIEAAREALPELVAEEAGSGPVATLADVQAPPDFEVRMFAAPPIVNYPVCLTAAATGEVFVGIDEQGSLGKEPGRGRIVRCVDVDGDGRADQFTTFATVDHPRGLIYDQGRLWVLHPPTLSLLVDEDGDGVADRQQTLISGISTEQVAARGADHTTNGIRMGIDGWIYIAVGDFGFVNATGVDGRMLSRRGGGIVRVRPDGTDMEVFSWGQRNILDVCIDPLLNMFTRDNTNDGGGWDIRVTHILQGADYGYPSLYINYPDETMPPLADYGGGSGCGAMTVFEPRWPAAYGNAVYTCDWGTSKVYRHRPAAVGATFAPDQDVFLDVPRPTDIDIDGSGRMFVSSWKNGGFNYSGPNIGFVAQLVPRDFLAKPFPDVSQLGDAALVGWMRSGTTAHTLPVQQEILRRAVTPQLTALLDKLVEDDDAPLAGRVAALFTLKQWHGAAAHARLLGWIRTQPVLREFALRALTDRLSELDGVDAAQVAELLRDDSPRVRAQTLISLARLGQAGKVADVETLGSTILPLAIVRGADGAERTEPVAHNVADAARVIPHLAVRALRDLGAVQACLEGVESHTRRAALWALKGMHRPEVVDGVAARLADATDPQLRTGWIDLLGRLHFREAEYSRGDWWGTRPDTTGPYYDRATWSESARIQQILLVLRDGTESDARAVAAAAERYRLPLGDNQRRPKMAEGEKKIVVMQADPDNPHQIGNLSFEQVAARSMQLQGDATRGRELFISQSCSACHTIQAGEQPKGPHLADIGKRYQRAELLESIVKPNAKIAQGFDTWAILTAAGQVHTGFIALESAEAVLLRGADGLGKEILKEEIESRKKQEQSMMPGGLVDALTPEQLSDLLAFLESLK